MPTLRRLTLTLTLAALAAATTTPAVAGCKLARDHACAREGAQCRLQGRVAYCRTYHAPAGLTCICSTPIIHGGGQTHRR